MKRFRIFLAIFFLVGPLFAQTNYARMLSGVNAQTGTTYTFVVQDATRLTTFANADAVAVTLPSGATEGFGAGRVFSALNLGKGMVTITCSGCLILADDPIGSATLTLAQGMGADIYSAGSDYSSTGTGGGGGGACTAPFVCENPTANQTITGDYWLQTLGSAGGVARLLASGTAGQLQVLGGSGDYGVTSSATNGGATVQVVGPNSNSITPLCQSGYCLLSFARAAEQYAVNSVAFSTTPTIDLFLGNIAEFTCSTPGSAITPAFTDVSVGGSLVVSFTQNSTTACTWTWPSHVSGGGTVDATLGATSTQAFYSFDGVNLDAYGPLCSTSAPCAGGGGVTGSGASPYFPVFTNSSGAAVLGNSNLQAVTSPNGVKYTTGSGQYFQLDASHLSFNTGIAGSSNVVIQNTYAPGSNNQAGGMVVEGAPATGSACAGPAVLQGAGTNGSANGASFNASGGCSNGYGAMGADAYIYGGSTSANNGGGNVHLVPGSGGYANGNVLVDRGTLSVYTGSTYAGLNVGYFSVAPTTGLANGQMWATSGGLYARIAGATVGPFGTVYSLPTATSSVLGGVKPDGTSILNTAGAISATAASVGAVGNPSSNGIVACTGTSCSTSSAIAASGAKCYPFQGSGGTGCDTPSGAGNVTSSSSPAAHQPAIFTSGTDIKGATAGGADAIFMGNDSGATGDPAFKSGPSGGTNGCAGTTDTPIYNTSTHTWGCHQITPGTPYPLQINGTGLTTADTVNFNATTPAAPTGGLNLPFATSRSSTTDSVSVALPATAVSPASYTNANITVDQQGRVTAASNGSSGTGNTTSTSLTTNTIPKANGPASQIDSHITDDGTTVTVGTGSGPVDLVQNPLATEVANDGTTGTTINLLAKVTTTGAILTATGDSVSSPANVVVANAGTTGNAQLAEAGVASCVMNNSASNTEGQPVFKSVVGIDPGTPVAGRCYTVTAASAVNGWFYIGHMVDNSTVAGSSANLIAHYGWFAANQYTLDKIASPVANASFTAPATNTYSFLGTAPASISSGTGTAAGTLFTVTAPAGGATTGTSTTGGAGGLVAITAGAGGSGAGGTNASGGAGGSINLVPGLGGAKQGSGTAGANGQVNIGTPGTIGGVLGLAGLTSGTATIAAPAVAGTTSNPFLFSNNIGVGLATNGVIIGYGTSTQNTGIGDTGAGPGTLGFYNAGTLRGYFSSNGLAVQGGKAIWFTDFSTYNDTYLSRASAGVMQLGSTTAAATGTFKAAAYMSAGTTFTSNSGCSETTLVGGATAGTFTSGTASACTIIVTMGNTATAPHGWSCWANDQTAVPAVAIRQTASSTTTASLLMTVASSDVINFGCMGY